MTQKTALVLSLVLTAFVLVMGGGLVARVSQSTTTPVEAAAASTAVPTAAPTVAPTADVAAQVQQLMQQRDAQYRQLIDQANQRLADMNTQLAAAQAAQAATARSAAARTTASSASAQAAAPQITLSPDAARDIAIQATNFATMIRAPELVRFEGKVAYEIGFTRGVVYIDANTGAVLYNGAQGSGHSGGGGQPASQPSAPSSGEHDSHDSEGHDD